MILDIKLYKTKGYLKSFMAFLTFFLKRVVPGKGQKVSEIQGVDVTPVRGAPYLKVDGEGQLKCTGCDLCVMVCPADCIHITSSYDAKNPDKKVVSSFYIEILRCMFCGYCEEACPDDALDLSGSMNLADFAETEWLFDHYKLSRKNDSMAVEKAE